MKTTVMFFAAAVAVVLIGCDIVPCERLNEMAGDPLDHFKTTCGVGACQAIGTFVCEDKNAVEVCTPGTPSPEVCDGIDNDCDGLVDEDFIPVTSECGVGSCASSGMQQCVGGQVVDTCVPGAPSDEICSDNNDNDCNGIVDDCVVQPEIKVEIELSSNTPSGAATPSAEQVVMKFMVWFRRPVEVFPAIANVDKFEVKIDSNCALAGNTVKIYKYSLATEPVGMAGLIQNETYTFGSILATPGLALMTSGSFYSFLLTADTTTCAIDQFLRPTVTIVTERFGSATVVGKFLMY